MTENDSDFKQMIKDLRIIVEKAAEELKKIETTGTESDATRALWATYDIWTGKEYGDIENALRAKGHKSSLDIVKSPKSQLKTENSSLELQDKIYENLRELLERDYNNVFVAITYDGKIMASDNDNVGLLKKLKELNCQSDQVFIRKVGAISVAGCI